MTKEEVLNEIYEALLKPKGFRRRLLKWLFPEIIRVAEILREYFWNQGNED